MNGVPDNFDLYLNAESIADIVVRMAEELDVDCQGFSLTVIGILKGSFVFLADLLRAIRTPVDNVEFLRISSYGPNTVSSGDPERLDELPNIVIEGRHLLVVEDIIDTGFTTDKVIRYLGEKNPESLRLCCLLDKSERRQINVDVDHIGATVPDLFFVGYGLDLDQKFRQLANIYSIS